MKHRHTIRILCCLLLLALIASFSAAAPSFAEAASIQFSFGSPAVPEQVQRKALLNAYSTWAVRDSGSAPWFYAFTDLDHNGQLEVLTAYLQGTGLYTTAAVWQLNSDFSSVSPCRAQLASGDHWPDIIQNSFVCYYDRASNSYTYVFEDVTRESPSRYQYSWRTLLLNQQNVSLNRLGTKIVEYTNVNAAPTVVCTNQKGESISETAYNSIPELSFAGRERSNPTLNWIPVESAAAASQPVPKPTPIPTPAPTPVPTQNPALPQVLITKNPTSESMPIGGRTWFIAHAQGSNSVSWQLLSPDGRVYSVSEAMALNPGLALNLQSGGDTIEVSNVPLSLTGWGFQARFDNSSGNFALTSPAYLYVGDFLSAYSSVIEKYRNAYQTGNRQNAQYAYQVGISEMTVYSSHVGYGFKDLDKDGIPELVIAPLDGQGEYRQLVLDVYSLNNGIPVNLARSQARSRFFLRSNSNLLNEGSSGAGFSNCSIFRVSGYSLIPVESIMSYFPGNASDGYYFQTGAYSYEPRATDAKISEADYQARQREYESTLYLPPLTKIA